MPFNKTLNITWHDHLENMSGLFQNLYENKKLVDVTLSCLEGSLKAHRLVLSACSPYFEKVFHDNPCKHPVLILKGISFYEMQQLLEFMYKGSINIPEHELSSLIQTAADLDIKGLTDNLIDYHGKVTYSTKESKSVSSAENVNTTNTSLKPKCKLDDDVHSDISECSKTSSAKNVLADEVNTLTDDARQSIHGRDTRFKGKKRVAVHISSRNVKTKYSNINPLSNAFQHSQQINQEDYSLSNIIIKDVHGAESDVFRDSVKLEVNSNTEDDSNVPDSNQDMNNSILIPDVELNDDVKCDMDNYNISRQDSYKLMSANFECTYCNKKFRSENDLFCHVRIHVEIKPFSCDFCGSCFTRSSHLARHRRTHTGERPFECSYCEKSFSRQDKLKLHIRSHDKDYQPPQCKITVKKEPLDPHGDVKRPRGRPRKYPLIEKSLREKRPRGRPRKVSVSAPGPEGSAVNSSVGSTASDAGDALSDSFTYVTSMPVETEYRESPAAAAANVPLGTDAPLAKDAVGLLDSVRQIGECTIQAVPPEAPPPN